MPTSLLHVGQAARASTGRQTEQLAVDTHCVEFCIRVGRDTLLTISICST